MFEGIQERLTTVGDAIAQWVDMDHERGARMERVFNGIYHGISSQEDQAKNGIVRSIVVNSDIGTNTALAKPKEKNFWIVESISVAIPNAIAARQVVLYVGQSTDDVSRPLAGVQTGTATAWEGQTSGTQAYRDVTLPLPDGMGIYAKGLAMDATEFLILHLIVREFVPKSRKLSSVAEDEAVGSHEGRPSENKINFGRPEVPQEQGTQAKPEDGGMAPAVPSIGGIPAGLNGAPGS